MGEAQAASATIEDRRKSARTDLDEVAFIFSSGSSTRCRLVNLSDDGAAIVVPDATHIPVRFQMMTERDRAVFDCRIAWIKGNRIGVEFATSSEAQLPVAHRERQFLQYLRDGQWRRATILPDSKKLISKLLLNGWIESCGSGYELRYRITQTGLAAKFVPVKL